MTSLTLNRLAEREVGAIIDGVIGNKLLSANIRQDIIERTDGIPLFCVQARRDCRCRRRNRGSYCRAFANLFEHALVQDAAYDTLLRGPRRALHTRIAETLESQFADIAENRPEMVARHFTQAGLIEKAAAFWGKAGLRSLERSAFVEASEQLARALSQIETLPSTPARRQAHMKLQAMLIIPPIHTKGYAALETIAAVERASLLIEQAKAIGEPPEDPLLLFAVLGGSFAANVLAGNVEACHDVATRMLDLAEKQQASAPLVIGRHHVGAALMLAGEIAKGKAYFDQAIELYVPAEHRPLMAHFGQDLGVSALVVRSIALWMLGSPDAALADACGQGRTGHRSHRIFDVCAGHGGPHAYALRELRGGR